MTLRISLFILATLTFITVLATVSANAYPTTPEIDDEVNSVTLLSTGPLNVVTYRVSER